MPLELLLYASKDHATAVAIHAQIHSPVHIEHERLDVLPVGGCEGAKVQLLVTGVDHVLFALLEFSKQR